MPLETKNRYIDLAPNHRVTGAHEAPYQVGSTLCAFSTTDIASLREHLDALELYVTEFCEKSWSWFFAKTGQPEILDKIYPFFTIEQLKSEDFPELELITNPRISRHIQKISYTATVQTIDSQFKSVPLETVSKKSNGGAILNLDITITVADVEFKLSRTIRSYITIFNYKDINGAQALSGITHDSGTYVILEEIELLADKINNPEITNPEQTPQRYQTYQFQPRAVSDQDKESTKAPDGPNQSTQETYLKQVLQQLGEVLSGVQKNYVLRLDSLASLEERTHVLEECFRTIWEYCQFALPTVAEPLPQDKRFYKSPRNFSTTINPLSETNTAGLPSILSRLLFAKAPTNRESVTFRPLSIHFYPLNQGYVRLQEEVTERNSPKMTAQLVVDIMANHKKIDTVHVALTCYLSSELGTPTAVSNKIDIFYVPREEGADQAQSSIKQLLTDAATPADLFTAAVLPESSNQVETANTIEVENWRTFFGAFQAAQSELTERLIAQGVHPGNIQYRQEPESNQYIFMHNHTETFFAHRAEQDPFREPPCPPKRYDIEAEKIIRSNIFDPVLDPIKKCTFTKGKLRYVLKREQLATTIPDKTIELPEYTFSITGPVTLLSKEIGTIIKTFVVKAEYLPKNKIWLISVSKDYTNHQRTKDTAFFREQFSQRSLIGEMYESHYLNTAFEGGLPGSR